MKYSTIELFHYITLGSLKKLAAISILFVFLCANTELRQLFKLPALIHHFLDHHHHDASTSIAGFFHSHYDRESSEPSDTHSHDHLPFKSGDSGFSQVNLALQQFFGFECKVISQIPLMVISLYANHYYSSSLLSRIWQPPRCA